MNLQSLDLEMFQDPQYLTGFLQPQLYKIAQERLHILRDFREACLVKQADDWKLKALEGVGFLDPTGYTTGVASDIRKGQSLAQTAKEKPYKSGLKACHHPDPS